VCAAKIGCFIGTMFTGILAYADNIALLPPTAAQLMLCGACETYAAEFPISFNASKSKCVVCSSRRMPKELNFVCDVKFTVNGNRIEVVQSWSHLGHIITTDMDDIRDIDRFTNWLVRSTMYFVHFIRLTQL